MKVGNWFWLIVAKDTFGVWGLELGVKKTCETTLAIAT